MIRPGTIADLDQISVVRTSVRENHMSMAQLAERGVTQASIAAQMQSGELGCWVAEVEGQVVGFSMAHRETANIFALFVLPDHEGQGLGSALIKPCESWLKSLGHAEAHLDTANNTRAAAFYRHQGWIAYDGPVHYENEVLFRKVL